MANTDCFVCCASFTSILRKSVQCSFCHYEVCQQCIKKYILSSSLDPQCMSCHVPWTQEFLDTFVSKSFRDNEYKKHRQNMLLEREKSFLPMTIPIVEIRVMQKNNDALMIKHKALRQELLNISNQNERMILRQEMLNIITQIRTNERMLYNLMFREQPEKERRAFIKACVMQDCRGFLSSQWKCGVCSTKVCSDCHEPKLDNTEHVCDPNSVESAKLLAKETKPCPKCVSAIYRISGCDLMFCTMCHVSFSWKSGTEVVPANNHNPHYLDFVRRTNNGVVPRAPGDVPLACGGFPSIWTLDSFVKANHKMRDVRLSYIMSLQRIFHHIIEYEIPHERREIDLTSLYQEYRVKYLMNEITEEEWKRELQKKEKKNNFKKDKGQVFEMLITVASDIMNRLILSKGQQEIVIQFDEMQNLLTYFNQSILNVHKRFGYKSTKAFNAVWVLAPPSTT